MQEKQRMHWGGCVLWRVVGMGLFRFRGLHSYAPASD